MPLVAAVPDSAREEAPSVHMAAQLWAVSAGRDVPQGDMHNSVGVFFRRARLRVELPAARQIRFRWQFAFDGLGRRAGVPVFGPSQPAAALAPEIFDAFAEWTVASHTSLLAGYHRPQLGRDHITAAFAVPVAEKALANFYSRDHLLGKASGREPGLTVIHRADSSSLSISAGVFIPQNTELYGGSPAALFAFRISKDIGAAPPEPSSSPPPGYATVSLFGAYAAAHATEVQPTGDWQRGVGANALAGADAVYRHGRLRLEAEAQMLLRSFSHTLNTPSGELAAGSWTSATVGHIRAVYLFEAAAHPLELALSAEHFRGSTASPTLGGCHSVVQLTPRYHIEKEKVVVFAAAGWVQATGASLATAASPDKASWLLLGLQVVR